MNEEAVVESHHHHHSHSPQQSQMIDSIEKDRLDDVVVEEDENVPEIELKKKRESIGNQSDDSIENPPCIDDENDEDDAESRMKQEIIEERINTRGVKFVADSAIVGGTNPSLISSTNSNISSTSSMSKSSSLNNNNNNNNTNSNPSQTSPSSQQPQQPSQQQQQSSANSQSSSPSLSVSPRLKSQTNSKSEKISPGLAKRVQAPEEEDNSQNEEQHNQNQEEENVEVVEEKQTKTTTLAGSSNRRTMAPSSTASKSASSKNAANPAAAAAKIQNALEKNMQRLNLYRPNSQSAGGHKQQHAANLSKEDIELFTNPDYDSTSTTLASSSSINGNNGNQDEDVEYSTTTTTTTTSRSIRPTGTVGGPYYLGKIPEHKTVEQSSKAKGQYQQQQCQQVINRSSTDREMTPDSIDNDTPQHRVSTRPNTSSRLVSKRGVNTSTSTSRNIPNSKKAPINQRTQPQSQPQPQKTAQQKIGVGKVNGNRKIVIPDEEEEERYEKGEDSRCGKAVATAKKVPPAAAAAASVQQLDEEDELNNGVYIEEQDEDELDEDEYERYHRHHHHHHHHDHDHYEDAEDDDEEYLDEDAEQHDDYDDDYEDEQDHSHNAHAMYNNQRHGYHHQYPHDHEHHHAHHRQHQENNNTNKNNRSQYTKTNNYNNPIPKPIEPPKTSGAVSSSSRTAANNTNNRQDQVSKTRRVSTESESSTSKTSANANKAAAKQGKSEAMSRSATSGDCSARRPGGPVRRKSTTASDDREFIDTDEETNKLLDTARTVAEYHDEETDEDKARRNGQDKSAVAAKSSNPSTSSQDNDRNVDRQQKSKETQPPPSTTHQIMDPDNQVLIEGVLFRARYLGSTQLVTDGNPTKLTRMLQAQEAVGRIKAPEGESQPSVEVDLFVSTEKIMVLNTDLQEIMMDHSLRSISYIADIGNLVVLMAKRRPPGGGQESGQAAAAAATSAPSKILCHVFESPEAQLVAQSIGQAFQVAYMEYLRANGIDDLTIMKDLDYQEVLNQQEIMGNELAMFAKKECQKEVLVPKQKNEPLGLVIVESGWGSMLPTVVVANMAPTGPAARCGALNIGDQIISCNGISMVGLPLSTCQTHVKNTRHLTLVRLVVVPCPPVVEVLIKRPDTKYQLGFSVQDGIICSLLRGGIAERGGVRVGHRIIEINGHSVVATTHDKIVNMLANSVGELRMKTMPTQMFRLLTGQELPVYI